MGVDPRHSRDGQRLFKVVGRTDDHRNVSNQALGGFSVERKELGVHLLLLVLFGFLLLLFELTSQTLDQFKVTNTRGDELFRQGGELGLVTFGELLGGNGFLLLGLDDLGSVVLGLDLLLGCPGRLLRLKLDFALGHGRVEVTGSRWR